LRGSPNLWHNLIHLKNKGITMSIKRGKWLRRAYRDHYRATRRTAAAVAAMKDLDAREAWRESAGLYLPWLNIVRAETIRGCVADEILRKEGRYER
jgi:hypothetical protein